MNPAESPSGRATAQPWWRIGLFLGVLSLGSVGASHAAEARNIPFRRITPQQGLPSATVQQVMQSRDGFIWVASQEGLSRYDGYEFQSYRHDPDDPTSLSHNFVWALHEDREGAIWAATDGGGVSRLDRASREFRHFRHDPGDPQSLSSDRVRIVIEDRSGNLWWGTDDAGLSRLEAEGSRFERYRHDAADPSSLGGDRVRDLAEDRMGMLWVATDGGGLSVLNPRTGEATTFRHDPDDATSISSNRVRSVLEDSSGTIWVGTYDAGLNSFDRTTSSFRRFGADAADPSSLPAAKVRALLEDSTGTLWIGTETGLSEWIPDAEAFSTHRHDPSNPYSLGNDVVVSLFQDGGGVLWVGTFGGLNTWNVEGGTFTNHTRRSSEPGGLSDSWVSAFAEEAGGALWVGTFGGLHHVDRTGGRFEHLRHDPSDPSSLSDDRVMSLLVDSRGIVWVGTLAGGLNRFDRRTGDFKRFLHDPHDDRSLASNGVTSLLEDSDGRLWVGTYRGGLHRLDAASQSFDRFRHDANDDQSLSSDRVMSLYEDTAGRLWVATENAGVNSLDRATGRVVRYRYELGNPHSLSSDDSWFVTGDEEGNLWIGTRTAGLNQWHAADREAGEVRFRRLTINDGLMSNTVYAAVPDRSGELWISSNRGLTRLDPVTGELRHYDASRGLQGDEFNYAAAMRSYSGELFFGGINGFTRFHPADIRINERPPTIALTGFRKFNRPVDLGRVPEDLDEISVGYKDLAVTFQFAALDFTAPEKNRYMYRLEGFDPEWIDAGSMRQATYTNLDPGEYRLRVRAANSDGVWNEEGLAVELGVAPPPWRTWWAYGLYVLMAGGLMTLAASSLNRRRRQALALERANLSLRREIRERQAKEEALDAERRRAREYLDVAEVIMLALDPAGKVVLINQKGSRILGLSEDEIVGSDWLSRFVPVAHRAEVGEKLADIGSYQYYEYPVSTASGQERMIAWHSTQLPATGENPAIILSSGADVTQVRELERQVRFHQKMDALGTLAGGVAHDFNNILTAIFGYSTLTLGTLEPDSEQAGYLQNVVKACERAKDLVARILAFSRGGEQDRQAVDVGAVVAEAGELLRSSLPPSIDVRLQIDGDCPAVVGDSTQIHQVVMNLGTNAGQAMPDGGVLEIAVGVERFDRPVSAGREDLRPGTYVCLTVRDTGSGMDVETMDKAFDPFFTTKGIGQGTGLGLSVVHGIVTGHHGVVSVASTLGRGTKFTIYLPASQVEARQAAEREVELTGHERILFVDDEEQIARLAKEALQRFGYEVTASVDASEALAALQGSPRDFDLLITDHAMPAMSGLELFRRVRELAPDMPVIITSGRRTSELEDDLGFEFLQKPFSVLDIGKAVRLAISRRGTGAAPTVH